MIRFEKKTDDDDDGDEEKSSYIGKEAAKTMAFAHAGVTASQAKYVEVELHGSVYEVEFVVNTTEYEYKINAQTGSVIHYEKDEKGNTSSVSGTSLIGEEQAKATAFSHAGVTASQVKYLEVELHGNAYEVEFHEGNTEYEDAIDGVMLFTELHFLPGISSLKFRFGFWHRGFRFGGPSPPLSAGGFFPLLKIHHHPDPSHPGPLPGRPTGV